MISELGKNIGESSGSIKDGLLIVTLKTYLKI